MSFDVSQNNANAELKSTLFYFLSMDLELFLKLNRMSPAAFAKKANTSKHTIYNILKRKCKPDLENIVAIMNATNDQVEPRDLLRYFKQE